MKPAVVLYGEPHADADLVGSVTASDLKGARPDLLLVVGTTLKVPGTQRLVSELAKVIHPSFTQNGAADTTTDRPLEKQLSHPKTIFLNAEFPTQAKKWSALFDVWVQSDIQEFAKAVHDVKQSNATSKNKKREPLALGINQVFAASKPTVAAAIPKPQPTGSLLLKSKVSKPSSSKIKKPAAKAPKPGMSICFRTIKEYDAE